MSFRRLSSWLSPGRAGFAGIPGLSRPGDWQILARDAVSQCEGLVGEVVRAPPTVAVVRLLDDISDTLCQVLDAAEFCRNVHADPEWRQQAQQVCIDLSGYVQELNTHYGIYSALVHSLEQHDAAAASAAAAASSGMPFGGSGDSHPTSSSSSGSSGRSSSSAGYGIAPLPFANSSSGFSEEALLVGRMLRRDFERYGVHLPGEERDRMAALVQRGHQLGMEVTHNVMDPRQLGSLQLRGSLAGAVQQLPQSLQNKFRPLAASASSSGGAFAGGGSLAGLAGLAAPADTPTLHSLLRTARDEGLRRAAFEACHKQPAANLAALDALVEARHEMASLMGFPSYASYQLDSFSLASSPPAVTAFLDRFAAAIAPKCAQEMQELRKLKALNLAGSSTSSTGGTSGTVSNSSASSAAETVQPWDRQFLCAAARSGADAAQLNALPDYFELERVVEGLSALLEQSMGVRLEAAPLEKGEGWAPGVRKLMASHDTDGSLGVVYLDLYRRPHKFPSAAHFTLRCGRRLADGSYQTPVVALVANMAEHSPLAVSEVEMLFHEFGHALNSLLSRTEFQHLSGTRGPLDMVEVPSHTLELFASDPRILSRFARHRTTGERLPPALLAALGASRRRFVALDQQQQLQYCLIDQLLHGADPPTGQRAQRAIDDIMRQHSALGHAEGCHPHIRFTHLVGYGATYYSYFYAQSLAAQLWEDHLAADPTSRTAGELLRTRLMQPGGAKEAHCMVEDLLGDSSGSTRSTSSSSGSSSSGSSSSSDGSGSSSGSAGSTNGSGGSSGSADGSSGSSGSIDGSSGGSGSKGGNGLCRAGGGYYPDPTAMLRHQGLLVE